MKHILVSGGAGYIGSHTVLELLRKDYAVSVVDNYCNSSPESLRRVEKLTGKKITSHKLDIRDKTALKKIVDSQPFEAVIHFAGLKAVGESVEEPLAYYNNNVGGIIALLEAIQGTSVKKFIFSSTAVVYGDQPIPYTEQTIREPESPYGNTKFASELIMADVARTNPDAAMIALRYFNPAGAHASGDIGEDPHGIPNNLMPFVAQVATGRREKLRIFGNDYPTADGTGERDYIHVVDVAKGHIAALEHGPATGFQAYNLGRGKPESVLAVVKAFERASGRTIPYEFTARRPGDLPVYYADPSLAERELHWKASLTLDDACADAWRWQSKNPNGYKTATIMEEV